MLIPNRVIYPGETIELAALKQVTLMAGKHKPDAVATRAEELIGKIAKRTLLPGRYIPATAIREAGWSNRARPCRSSSSPAD